MAPTAQGCEPSAMHSMQATVPACATTITAL